MLAENNNFISDENSLIENDYTNFLSLVRWKQNVKYLQLMNKLFSKYVYIVRI